MLAWFGKIFKIPLFRVHVVIAKSTLNIVPLFDINLGMSDMYLALHMVYSADTKPKRGFEDCKSTKFGVLLNLADLALGQKLNRTIQGKTSIITQNVVNPPNFIAAKYC